MDLVEKVARALANIEEQIYSENDHWVFFTEDAEAAIDIVLEEAAKVIDDWNNPNDLQLHAGEMTAQERRTTMAVLTALARKIRTLKE